MVVAEQSARVTSGLAFRLSNLQKELIIFESVPTNFQTHTSGFTRRSQADENLNATFCLWPVGTRESLDHKAA